MSLGVSPSSSSPLTTHSRPLPPNRKRLSYTPSPRATPRIRDTTILEADCEEDQEDSRRPSAAAVEGSPPKIDARHGMMGGLRERSEEKLGRASREGLEEALREEWEVRDRLLSKLETVSSDRDKSKMKCSELVKSISALQARTEEALHEQSRMEADLEDRDELLDRLRKRLSESERQVRESQRRHIEQEKTFDIERQALQAQEAHLLSRLKSQSSSRQPLSSSKSPGDTSLRDELASMNVSHSTLLAKLNTLTKDLQELKVVNAQLAEENEGWEFLIRERTLNGKVRQGGLLGHGNGHGQHREEDEGQSEAEDNSSRPGSICGGASHHRPLEALDEELEQNLDLEAEMEELHSDLEAQSPIFEDTPESVRDLDANTHRASLRGDRLAPPVPTQKGKAKRNKSGGENLGDLPLMNNGLDLAAELGRAEVDLGGNDLRVLEKGGEGEALRAEIKQLREANKALTLYCSKIIDRIIASEGFEHILSVDYKTRRGTRTPGKKSRIALDSLSLGSRAMETIPPLPVPSPAESMPLSDEPVSLEEKEPKKEKKARPLSMMVRAISGPAPAEKTTPSLVPPSSSDSAVQPETKETKSEKRARRGFSLDFRSLGFGSSAVDSPRPVLRPLMLSSRSSSSTAVPTRSATAALAARKLEVQAEDEEDRRERHRMEATLKLMGIERPNSAGSNTRPDIRSEAGEGYGVFAPSPSYMTEEGEGGRRSREDGRVSEGSTVSRAGRGTPLSRLSSAIGIGAGERDDKGGTSSDTSDSTLPRPPTEEELANPERAAAALKAFDQREARHAKALSKGTAQVGYTSPPKIGSGLGRLHRSSSSAGANAGAGDTATDRERNRMISKSESINTLWSMGGSSRPTSGEVAPS